MVFPNNKVFEPLFGRSAKQEAQKEKPEKPQAVSDEQPKQDSKAESAPEKKVSTPPPQKRRVNRPQPVPTSPVFPRRHVPNKAKQALAGLGSTSQGRVLLLLAIVIVILAIVVYFYYNMSKKNRKSLKRLNRDVDMIKRIQRKRSMLRRNK